MFFKSLHFFAFTRPFTWTQEQLEQQLSECKFTPCGSTELSHFGFTPALGKASSALAHQAGGHVLFCARKEEKILPAPVIKDMLDERIDEFAVSLQHRPSKKEKEQMKEDIIFELLPRAFSRITDTHAYINAELNLIVVNANSRGKAEDILALLRKAIGTLPVTSFTPDTAPDETMTRWLREEHLGDELGDQFEVGSEVELVAIGDDAATAKLKNENLSGVEVQAHLDDEKFVSKIGLSYDETMSFVLCDDLSIRRVKYFDVLTEQNDDIDSDDHLARVDADFTLMAGETNRMIVDLLSEFGLKAGEYLD